MQRRPQNSASQELNNTTSSAAISSPPRTIRESSEQPNLRLVLENPRTHNHAIMRALNSMLRKVGAKGWITRDMRGSTPGGIRAFFVLTQEKYLMLEYSDHWLLSPPPAALRFEESAKDKAIKTLLRQKGTS